MSEDLFEATAYPKVQVAARIKDLTKAGALIAAELDRILRFASPAQQPAEQTPPSRWERIAARAEEVHKCPAWMKGGANERTVPVQPPAAVPGDAEFTWGSVCSTCGLEMPSGRTRDCIYGGKCSWFIPPAALKYMRDLHASLAALQPHAAQIRAEALEEAACYVGRHIYEHPAQVPLYESAVVMAGPKLLAKELRALAAQPTLRETAPAEHVAWLHYRKRHSNSQPTIHVCDSNSPGAFKVYRTAPADAALECVWELKSMLSDVDGCFASVDGDYRCDMQYRDSLRAAIARADALLAQGDAGKKGGE